MNAAPLLPIAIQALLTSGVLGVGAFLLRGYISKWLARSVEFQFDKKLEAVRSDFRVAEERFRADLRSNEASISALREGALSGMAARQVAVDKRRLEAIEKLWMATVDLGRLEGTLSFMSILKLDAVAKRNEPKLQAIFKAMTANIDTNNLPGKDAARERPFVSEIAWAIFSAYQSILIMAFGIAKMLELGADASGTVDQNKINTMLKAVLPEYADYIDQHGMLAHHFLVDELKTRLIAEFKKMLDGADADSATVANAGKILRATDAVRNDLQKKIQEAQVST